MRLKVLMRDTEYRDALIEMISEFDKDVFVDIADSSSVDKQSVLLTDISPAEIESDSLMHLKNRTVFISSEIQPENNADDDINTVFKYSSIDNVMAEISRVYYRLTGNSGSFVSLYKIIAICSDYILLSQSTATSLARQIVYRRGGSVLILPLGFINDYRDNSDPGLFQKLMYLIDSEQDYPATAYTRTDSYGISYLRMSGILNPAAYLEREYLAGLIKSLGTKYETLILDIGTCYRRENLEILRQADDIVFTHCGRRIGDIRDIIGADMDVKIHNLLHKPEADDVLAVDECVREIYGIKESGDGT